MQVYKHIPKPSSFLSLNMEMDVLKKIYVLYRLSNCQRKLHKAETCSMYRMYKDNANVQPRLLYK